MHNTRLMPPKKALNNYGISAFNNIGGAECAAVGQTVTHTQKHAHASLLKVGAVVMTHISHKAMLD